VVFSQKIGTTIGFKLDFYTLFFAFKLFTLKSVALALSKITLFEKNGVEKCA